MKEPFSIFWEVRALLYLGILFLSSGLGILIYRNIDTIGHQTILALLILATAGCFWYCARHAKPFTTVRAAAESWSDYMLLLGALLFGVLTGYLQIKYSVFGAHHGLALSVPAACYLFLAYRFDHRGVLQLAISGFCAAAGIVATPLEAIRENLISHRMPVWTGLAMGAVLAGAGALSEMRGFKRHFTFSYINFSVHLSAIAAVTGLMMGEAFEKALFFFLLAALARGLWTYARRNHNYYFLLCAVVYGYIAITYVCMHWLFNTVTTATFYAAFLYFMLSCAGTIMFFLNMKKFLGNENAGLPQG